MQSNITENNLSTTIERLILLIEKLIDKIKNNNANETDYLQFEEIMVLLGLNKKIINDPLNKYGFNNYKEYIKSRNNTKDLNNIVPNSAILGTLTGVSMAAIEYLHKLKLQNHDN